MFHNYFNLIFSENCNKGLRRNRVLIFEKVWRDYYHNITYLIQICFLFFKSIKLVYFILNLEILQSFNANGKLNF